MMNRDVPLISEDEYIARERAAERKSEYFRGHVFAMAGGSPRHNLIVGNIIRAVGARLENKPCVVLPPDQRVCVQDSGLYTYPDVTVVCGGMRMHPRFSDTLVNPTVIFEVLSPSTEAYDAGVKFAHYRRIPSLREYVLVSQSERLVEHYRREAEGDWHLSTWGTLRRSDTGDETPVGRPGREVPLPALELMLPFEEIYAKFELLPAVSEGFPPDLPRPKTLR